MKKIISLLMVLCMFSGLYVKAAEDLEANVVLQFSNPGNIYFTGDTENLKVTYFNNSSSDMDLDVSFVATGRKFSNVNYSER